MKAFILPPWNRKIAVQGIWWCCLWRLELVPALGILKALIPKTWWSNSSCMWASPDSTTEFLVCLNFAQVAIKYLQRTSLYISHFILRKTLASSFPPAPHLSQRGLFNYLLFACCLHPSKPMLSELLSIFLLLPSPVLLRDLPCHWFSHPLCNSVLYLYIQMDQAEHSGEEGTSKVLTVPSGLNHCHLPMFLDSLSDQMASRFEILPCTFKRIAGFFLSAMGY